MLQADLWRAVSCFDGIDETLSQIADILKRQVPFDVLLVRQFDVERATPDTVWLTSSAAAESANLPPNIHYGDSEIENYPAWGELQAKVKRPDELFPGLVADRCEGDALVGPIQMADGKFGILKVLTRQPNVFSGTHAALLENALSPIAVALENDRRRQRELAAARASAEINRNSAMSRLGIDFLDEGIIGFDGGLRFTMERAILVAPTTAPVLLLGETGSGKEVVARTIHRYSRRSAGPFLRVNCGAIPPELIDSEFFGHERGSFTGAYAARKGWFERAEGGTLFLDECGELPLDAQVRLLRVLQDGTFERVGGETQMHCDVRIVAATNRDLHAMLADGRFREDLWYRLAVFPVRIPPLRERVGDIPIMARHFACRAAARLELAPCKLTASDEDLLVRHTWPGNVRELAAVIERAAILGRGTFLDVASAIAPSMHGVLAICRNEGSIDTASDAGSFDSLDEAIAKHIKSALHRTNGVLEGPSGAATLLGINPHTLRSRMKKLNINWQRYRKT